LQQEELLQTLAFTDPHAHANKTSITTGKHRLHPRLTIERSITKSKADPYQKEERKTRAVQVFVPVTKHVPSILPGVEETHLENQERRPRMVIQLSPKKKNAALTYLLTLLCTAKPKLEKPEVSAERNPPPPPPPPPPPVFAGLLMAARRSSKETHNSHRNRYHPLPEESY